jgi:3-hydroxybutyryl-CoA dehydrogenase
MSIKAQNPIGIIGAGTMGAGIAQAAANAGWPVKLYDVNQTLVDLAEESLVKRFERLVEKDRMTNEESRA